MPSFSNNVLTVHNIIPVNVLILNLKNNNRLKYPHIPKQASHSTMSLFSRSTTSVGKWGAAKMSSLSQNALTFQSVPIFQKKSLLLNSKTQIGKWGLAKMSSQTTMSSHRRSKT